MVGQENIAVLKEDLCHAFKGLRSESIAYREFECGWKTRRLVFWHKFRSS